MNEQFSIKLLKKFKETIVDGIGIRYSLYFSGCSHKCVGCHNEYSWNPNNGTPISYETLEQIVKEINENIILDGITVTGGDPLYNPIDMLKILKYLKEKTKKNIWLYTGYTLEEIKNDKNRKKCLDYIDVLVDGPFIKKLYDPTLKFRGSSNQKIIKKEEF